MKMSLLCSNFLNEHHFCCSNSKGGGKTPLIPPPEHEPDQLIIMKNRSTKYISNIIKHILAKSYTWLVWKWLVITLYINVSISDCDPGHSPES